MHTEFWWENHKKTDHWEDGVSGKLILQLILEE
jgi:hypothetical protein